MIALTTETDRFADAYDDNTNCEKFERFTYAIGGGKAGWVLRAGRHTGAGKRDASDGGCTCFPANASPLN